MALAPEQQQVRQVAVDRVQQCLAGLLTLDPRNLKQLVQSVLGSRDLLDDVQLLRVQDVQHVVEDGLQVARVQTHLPEHVMDEKGVGSPLVMKEPFLLRAESLLEVESQRSRGSDSSGKKPLVRSTGDGSTPMPLAPPTLPPPTLQGDSSGLWVETLGASATLSEGLSHRRESGFLPLAAWSGSISRTTDDGAGAHRGTAKNGTAVPEKLPGCLGGRCKEQRVLQLVPAMLTELKMKNICVQEKVRDVSLLFLNKTWFTTVSPPHIHSAHLWVVLHDTADLLHHVDAALSVQGVDQLGQVGVAIPDGPMLQRGVRPLVIRRVAV
ncbi:hypothetical protein EYF80_004654 [Liparis tanakae]|uniref:Uncharacterized protein n=1 Tax=Liparis tanakae TaxID=230148 RepID=A0A4Z2J493_9TELE|nr:hypothetical protein EYF80_004654 [Liparis tanakae]